MPQPAARPVVTHLDHRLHHVSAWPFRPLHLQILVQTSSHIRPVRHRYCSLPFSLYPNPGPVPGEGDRELMSTKPLEIEGSLQACGRAWGCFPTWPAPFSLFLCNDSLSPGHSPGSLPAEGWARVATMGPAAEPGTVGVTVDPSSRRCLGVVTCLPQSPRVAAFTPDQWDKNIPSSGFSGA